MMTIRLIPTPPRRARLLTLLALLTIATLGMSCASNRPVIRDETPGRGTPPGTGRPPRNTDRAPSMTPTPPTGAAPAPSSAPGVDGFARQRRLEAPAPNYAQNARVSQWLDTLAARNQSLRLTRGYRIQTYVGPDRAIALKAKEALYRVLGEQDPVDLTYDHPTFRVKGGAFLNRYRAHLALQQLRTQYPTAALVPEMVSLR